ncbi:MAG: HEAT repeat domain-containing protein [Deltaproteobacteria bacterium]|nr:HEAT repeat domain-containing protein [Deltaproteobacteria bacterium]
MREMRFVQRCYLVLISVIALSGCCREKDIPDHINKLYSGSAKDRNQAALDLSRCGSSAAKAVPRLGQLIYDENVGVQSSAAYALRRIDTEEARKILERAEAARRRK